MSPHSESELTLQRLQSRRSAGVPTVAVLVGPLGLAARDWLFCSTREGRSVAKCHGNQLLDLTAAWLTEARKIADPHAEAWLAYILGIPATVLAERLVGMTRYDFDTMWRTLPVDTTHPAATAAYITLIRRFPGTSTLAELPPLTLMRGFSELLPEQLWPTLLVAREHPSANPNWLAKAVRAIEPLIAAVPKLAVGVVASDAEYVAFTQQLDGSRQQTLAREGFVRVTGVSSAELVSRLAEAGLPPPPADTLHQLTTEGLSEEAAAAFIDTAKAVTAADESANSKAERFLFEQLNAHPPTAGLFRLNIELPFRHGKKLGEADLIAEQLKVVIEVDGAYWHLNTDQYRRDRRKDWLYQQHGYFVLRFLAEDVVKDLPTILATVTDAVAFRTSFDPRGAI